MTGSLFTSASASAPPSSSLPPETPRVVVYHPVNLPEKKNRQLGLGRRSKQREREGELQGGSERESEGELKIEPLMGMRNELVPSYDELYG